MNSIFFFLMTTDALYELCVYAHIHALNRSQCCFCSIFDYCIIDWVFVCLLSLLAHPYVCASMAFFFSLRFVVFILFIQFSSRTAKKLISMTHISGFRYSFFPSLLFWSALNYYYSMYTCSVDSCYKNVMRLNRIYSLYMSNCTNCYSNLLGIFCFSFECHASQL